MIGVDIIPSSISDAIYNSSHALPSSSSTSILADKVLYTAGRVEDIVSPSFLSTHAGPQDVVVAVLDPARTGVGSSVIMSIRGCERIRKVVYVACDFEKALQNLVELSTIFLWLFFSPIY